MTGAEPEPELNHLEQLGTFGVASFPQKPTSVSAVKVAARTKEPSVYGRLRYVRRLIARIAARGLTVIPTTRAAIRGNPAVTSFGN